MHTISFFGLQKLNTLNLCLFHSPLNPCNHFSTVLIKTNWYTISCKYSECSGLFSITIPGSVTSIGGYAFEECSGLTSISILGNLTSISERLFYNCSALSSANIPSSVQRIGTSAFAGCRKLTSIVFPDSVSTIEDYAFSNCNSLTSIVIPNNVTNIGEYAFQYCHSAKTLTLSDNLKIIKASTFHSCSSLREVVIPAKVEYIYTNAFSCYGLEKVTVLATTPPWAHENAFLNYDIPLYVPTESINSYQETTPWNKFKSVNTLSGDDDEMKCKKPTISYKDGQLTFNCETEDVLFRSKITDTDIADYETATLQLTVTYHISVYATKSGYQNSDVATATLCWIDVEPRTEGIENGIAEVRAIPVLIQSHNGVLTIEGLSEGTLISVYDLSGRCVGSVTSLTAVSTVDTSLNSGDTAIVKLGQQAVKVVMR